jgi:hypothetical protein
MDRFYGGQVRSFLGGGNSDSDSDSGGAAGNPPPHFVLSGEQDEPGFFWPVTAPPVRTSSRVRERWQRYLTGKGLSPRDLDAANWDEALPLGRTGAGAGGGVNQTAPPSSSSSLGLRRRYYWSMRFSVWVSTRSIPIARISTMLIQCCWHHRRLLRRLYEFKLMAVPPMTITPFSVLCCIRTRRST